jgi:GtrA-like protein
MTADTWRPTAARWLKFNMVGGMGIAVHLLMLVVLKSGLHLHYLAATALAVETAVVHNFLWHERFTWADRPPGLRPLLQVQPDDWIVLYRREPGIDEASSRTRTRQLSVGHRNHDHGVLGRQLPGQRWFCICS